MNFKSMCTDPWTKFEFQSHCQLEFGEYVQMNEDHDNSMQS